MIYWQCTATWLQACLHWRGGGGGQLHLSAKAGVQCVPCVQRLVQNLRLHEGCLRATAASSVQSPPTASHYFRSNA